MDLHDATEIAFKKGYKKAVREVLEDIDKNFILIPIYDTNFKDFKKKYTEGKR